MEHLCYQDRAHERENGGNLDIVRQVSRVVAPVSREL